MRFLEHVILAFIFLKGWRYGPMYRARNYPMQFLRGLFLFGSTIFNFFALRTLQLAETTSIAFFAPMLITALAGPLLGEWAGWRRWVAIIFGFVGVLVITRPGFGAFHMGHVLALLSTTSYCLYVIMTRAMGKNESAESMIFLSALAPTLFMLPFIPQNFTPPHDAFHWMVLLALGVFGGLGHWMVILAYRRAPATSLAPYPYLQMVWMLALGYIVFGQLPDGWTMLGSAIIVASGLYIVQRERTLRLRKASAPTAEDAELAKKL